MGSVELDISRNTLIIHAHIITYGEAANDEITQMIREEIETMWNEPESIITYASLDLQVLFKITATFSPIITDLEIYQNLDPLNNYFRIEEFSSTDISFVDGLGCNSGYFKKDNLCKGSTTAAHEFGHTLGLHHPKRLIFAAWGFRGLCIRGEPL